MAQLWHRHQVPVSFNTDPWNYLRVRRVPTILTCGDPLFNSRIRTNSSTPTKTSPSTCCSNQISTRTLVLRSMMATEPPRSSTILTRVTIKWCRWMIGRLKMMISRWSRTQSPTLWHRCIAEQALLMDAFIFCIMWRPWMTAFPEQVLKHRLGSWTLTRRACLFRNS